MESYEEREIKWLIDKPGGLLLTRRRLKPTPSGNWNVRSGRQIKNIVNP